VAVSNVELRVNATQAVTALKNVDGQAKKFNTTISGTSGKLKATTGSLKVLPAGLIATGGGAKVAAGGFAALTAAAAPLLGPLIGISAVIGALTKTFGDLAAQDFANAKVRALGVDVENLNPALASLSNELSGQVSKLDLLAASYDLASAGFGEVAELTDVLKASQLGASGGFSDLATVADATTSVLNSYGLEADKAGKIVDGFIQTQNDGRIVVDQYAQQIGRIAPIAAASGVSIDELNAAIAAVTATGVPVESTFAGLRQVISAIIKPTGEAAKTAEKLGIDFSAAALQSKGLSGVLSEIVEKSGGSSEEIAKLFGSVEALTAIQPLLNDELVKFNEALANQANAQGEAAKASFIASNTIQGQLTRLGTAFTNLTTEGSEFGIIIRESLKVAAVTVEALGAAFKIVLAPVRAVSAAVGEIGSIIGNALGIESTNVLFNLEQGWIGIKEAITDASDRAIFVGKVIGGVIGNAALAIGEFANGVRNTIGGLAQKIADFFKQAFDKIMSFIPEPLKRLLGLVELPPIDLKIKGIKDFGKNFLKGAKEKADALKNTLIEFSGVETAITSENEIQLQAANNIKDANLLNGKILKDNNQTIIDKNNLLLNTNTALTNGNTLLDSQNTKVESLKSKLQEVGRSVEQNLVKNLTDAVMGAQTFGQALTNVLQGLQRQLIEMAMQQAVSGLFGGLLGNLFGGMFGGGGGGLDDVPFVASLGGKGFANGGNPPVGKVSLVGEKGPELFVPQKSGTIIPNHALGGSTNVVVNVDASGNQQVQGDDDNAAQLGEAIAAAVQAEIVKQQMSGGLLS